MQSKFRILIILSLLLLIPLSVFSQKRKHSKKRNFNQKKTTLEAYAGISIANGTRLYNLFRDELAYDYTVKYRIGTKLYTSLGKRLNLGFGFNFFSTGYGYDSLIRIPKEGIDANGMLHKFYILEGSRFHRTYWYLGIPISLNFQINKPSTKSKFSAYFEIGTTPSFIQLVRDKNVHPDIKETELDNNPNRNNNLLLVNSSFVFTYKLSQGLSVFLRPSFQFDLIELPIKSMYSEAHHDFNLEAGVRTRLYKWWR